MVVIVVAALAIAVVVVVVTVVAETVSYNNLFIPKQRYGNTNRVVSGKQMYQ